MIYIDTMQFGNGAGSIKTLEGVRRACAGPMSRITVGSITKKLRAGNLGETYYFHPTEHWSLNALGLPNRGIEWYGPLWRDMIGYAHDAGKTIWASIAPFSAQECGEMTDRLLCTDLDGVEINGSCPNVWDNGKHETIPALDPATAAEMLRVTKTYTGNFSRVSFKLSPRRDLALLHELARVFREYHLEHLVCCNTIPDQARRRAEGGPALGFLADTNDTTIRRVGGLAGSAAIENSLLVAETMVQLLPYADVIGCGGIFTAVDAKRYLDIGCVGFQSTTGYLEFGERLFVDIMMQLAEAEVAC